MTILRYILQFNTTQAQQAIASLGGAFLNLRTIVAGAALAYAKDSVDAATRAESAFKGLESVANRTGVGIEKAWAAVTAVTADGVMSQTQAAAALKNLFARGFGIEESIQLMEAFKDSAAFGRQAGLEWGDAIVTATEGLKNENSALVDNAGVTKNVAKMWEDYAKKINVTADSLTLAQKREAELQGVREAAKNSLGDTQKALDGNQGASARLAKSYSELKTAIGTELTPAFQLLLRGGADIIDKVLSPMVTVGGAIVRTFTAVAGLIYDVVDAFKKADTFTQFSQNLRDKTHEQAAGAATYIREIGNKMGLMDAPNEMPPPPGKNTSAIPALSTNTTGIKLVVQGPPMKGPNGQVIKDNIDAKQVAANKAAAAKTESEEQAKQDYAKQEKAMGLARQRNADELSVYKAGLDSQQGALDLMLVKETVSREAHAQRSAMLETEALKKEESTRIKNVALLQAQLDNAKKTDNKQTIAEAQQAFDSEVSKGSENAAKLKTLQLKASKDVLEGYRADGEEKRRIDEITLAAKLSAEKTANDTLRAGELAALQAQLDERLIGETEYIRKTTAIQQAALLEELAGVKAQQALLAAQKPQNKSQAADDAARSKELVASATALEGARVTLAAEANSKIRLSAQQLQQIRRDLDQQLLEVEGKTFEAQSAAIDSWLEQKKLELAAFPELLAKAEAVVLSQKKQVGFDKVQQGISAEASDYQRKQEELQRRSQQGLITDIDLDRQSLELKHQQAAALRERLTLLQNNSNGGTANVQAIKEVEDQLASLDFATSAVAKSLNDNFFNAVEQGFQDMFTGAKKPLEALRDVAISVLKDLAKMALQFALQKAFTGAMGGGGLGGAVASIFGGARAMGGDTQSGKAYLIGERGPELMFPGANGRVVSNAQIQSAMAGMMRTQMPPPSAGFSSTRELAPAAGHTNVHVAPKVVVAAGDFLSAIQGMPEAERWIVQAVTKNGKKIQGAW